MGVFMRLLGFKTFFISLFVVHFIVGVAGMTSAQAARKSAAMAIDAHSGKILYSHNSDKPHAPASLTKVMTLYMLFEFIQAGRLSLSSPLHVTAHAASQQPSKLGLKVGSRIKVEDAIKAMIVKSANDVAVTVAENIAGSEWKFAKLMTWKARQMGMTSTRFLNASGLPAKKQITTARDMIILSQRIQKDFPRLYPYFSTKSFRYKGKLYKNYNRLLSRMRGVDGIKTGYTRASGYNLTSSVWKGRKHVVAVVMGGKTSKRRDAFMMRLLKKSLRKASKGRRKTHVVLANSRAVAAKREQMAQTPPQRRQQRPVVTPQTKKIAKTVPLDHPSAKLLGARVPAKGPYHIQIGAFGSEYDAQARLSAIGGRVSSLLKGHQSFTMLVPNQTIYRARFAGFSEQDARRTCRLLKKRAIECLAVPAE